MNFWDQLLIAWWLLLAATIIPLVICTRRLQARGLAVPCREYFGKSSPRHSWYSDVAAKLPTPLWWLATLSLIVCGIGFFCFSLFINERTCLLYLNGQLSFIAFCTLLVLTGAMKGIEFNSVIPRLVLRVSMLIFGALGLAFYALTTAADLLSERLIVEGRIEKMKSFGGKGHHYAIYIKEKRYWATEEAFSRVYPGEYVRAELGAGSRIIFDITSSRDWPKQLGWPSYRPAGWPKHMN